MSGRAPPTGPRALRTYIAPGSNQVLPSEPGTEVHNSPRNNHVNGTGSSRTHYVNGYGSSHGHSSSLSGFSRPPPSGPKASKLSAPGSWQNNRLASTPHSSSSPVSHENHSQWSQPRSAGIDSTGRAPISFTLPRASQPAPPPPGPEQRPPSPIASPPPPPPPPLPPADDVPPPPPPDTPPPAPSELPHLKVPIRLPPTLPQETRSTPSPFPGPKNQEESAPIPPSSIPPPLPPPDLLRHTPKPSNSQPNRPQHTSSRIASPTPFKPTLAAPPPPPTPARELTPPPPRPPTPIPEGVLVTFEKVQGKDSPKRLYSLASPPSWPPPRSELPHGRNFRVIFDSSYEPDREKDRYGSMKMLANRIREAGYSDRLTEGRDKEKEKGKGKLVIYRFDGETIEGEEEARPADPRKASGSGSRRPRFRNEFFLTSYEHDANSCGPAPTSNILVFGFPSLTTNQAIRLHFSKYGIISNLDRELDHVTGAAMDIVSIQFSTHADAAKAVAGENGKNFTNNVIGFGAAAVSLSNKQGGKAEVKVMFDGEGKLLKLLLSLHAEKRKKDKEPKPPPPPPSKVIESSGAGPSSSDGPSRPTTSASTYHAQNSSQYPPPPSWRPSSQPGQHPRSFPPHSSLPSRPTGSNKFNNFGSTQSGRGRDGFYRGTGAPRRGLPSALFRARSVNSVQATMLDGSPSLDSGSHLPDGLNDHVSEREFRNTRVGRSPSPTRIESPRRVPSPRRHPSPRRYHSPIRSLSPRRRLPTPKQPSSAVQLRSHSPLPIQPPSPISTHVPSPLVRRRTPDRSPSPEKAPSIKRAPSPEKVLSSRRSPPPERPPSPQRSPSPKRALSVPPDEEPPAKRSKLIEDHTEVVDGVSAGPEVNGSEANGFVPEPIEPQAKSKKTTVKKAEKERKEKKGTKQTKKSKAEQPALETIVITPAMEIDAPVVTELHLSPASDWPPASLPISSSISTPVIERPKTPPKLVDPLQESDLLELAEDDEDLYFSRLALSLNVNDEDFKVPDRGAPPAAHSSPPPLRKHATGSARTEGSYKIPHAEKSAYVAQYATRGAPTSDPKAKEVPPQQPNVSSRSNRANARRRAQGLDELNQLQLAVALSKGETAVTADSMKFNQLQTRKKHLRFARSPIHDWGLYAMERIGRGEMVIEYVGEIIRAAVADKREKVYERQGIGSSYLFRIDEDLVVDATKKGNLGRLINHSCDPNCTAKIITINGEKKIVIYAKEDIELGDEITYDYHFPIEQDKIPCLCGSAKCRGYLN